MSVARFARLAGAAAAVALGLVAAGPAALAATSPPAAVGWWTQRAGAEPRGGGGVEIASSVRGHESVAAVRVRLDAGATQPRLVLTEVPGVAPSDSAAFRACVATSSWEPADPGPWEQRPESDCSSAVDAVRVDPQHWAVDLAPLLAGGAEADVVLEPAPQEVVPGVPAARVFTLAFATVEVVTADAAGDGIPPGTVAPPVPSRPAGTSPTVSPVIPRVPAAPMPRTAPVVAPSTPTTTAPGGESALGSSNGTERVAIDAPTFDLVDSGGDERPWARLLLLVPLSALAGVAAAVVRSASQRAAEPV